MTTSTVKVNPSGSRAHQTVVADTTSDEMALNYKLQFADSFWDESKECPVPMRAKLASSTRAVLCENTIFDSLDLKRLSVKIVDGVLYKEIEPAVLSSNPMLELVLLVQTHDLLKKLCDM
jgi:hypothetical protein